MITELDAINTMLTSIGSAPTNSLTGVVPADVAMAKSILAEAKRTVLLRGWAFNSQYKVGFAPGNDGRIQVPDNMLRIDTNPDTYTTVDPVQRGQYLFDRKANSYTFGAPLVCDTIISLEWNALPEVAQVYIAAVASRMLVSRADAGQERWRAVATDEQQALINMRAHDTSNEDATIFDNETAFRILGRYR